MTETSKRNFLDKIGLSRRAGLAIIGQDRVRAAILEGKGPLMLFLASDASPAVKRRIVASSERRGDKHIQMQTVSRWELGAALGLASAQILGLPLASRFTETLLEDLRREGDVIE